MENDNSGSADVRESDRHGVHIEVPRKGERNFKSAPLSATLRELMAAKGMVPVRCVHRVLEMTGVEGTPLKIIGGFAAVPSQIPSGDGEST